MKSIYSMLALIFLSAFSCSYKSNPPGIKYSVFSYVGPATIDSLYVSKMDVYSFSDYLVRIEFVNSWTSNDAVFVDSASGEMEIGSAETTHAFIDTAKISIISKRDNKQYFVKSLGHFLKVDSVRNYSTEDFLFEFSRPENSEPHQRHLSDTTIKQARYTFEKTIEKSRGGEDSLTGYFYFYSEQPFNNVFTFPKPDNLAGIKLIFNQDNFFIEHLASGFIAMSKQELEKMTRVVKEIVK